jgi:PKHD-type hydroxylase
MTYQFAPASDFGSEETYATWVGGFTNEEMDSIIELGLALTTIEATINSEGSTVNSSIRQSKVGWLWQNEKTQWLYDRIAYIARQLNAKSYHFDLWGFVEGFQFTSYNGEGDHYDQHVDCHLGSNGKPSRKLSMVLQLSDPESYDGGELQIITGVTPESVKRERGMVCVFPSFRLHKVTPVTRGVRYSLVVWVTGPSFK